MMMIFGARHTPHTSTRLRIELALVGVSVAVAATLHLAEIDDRFLVWSGSWAYAGALLAGMLYASIFTVSFSLLVLAEYSATMPVTLLAILGGVGAAVADAVIFSFLRDELSGTLVRWVKHFHWRNGVARFFGRPHVRNPLLVACGVAVIASPLPDEVGIVLLSSSPIPQRAFTALSFVANGVGIAFLASAGASVL